MTAGSIGKRVLQVVGAVVLLLVAGLAFLAVFWDDRWYAAFGSSKYYIGVEGSSILGDKDVWIEIGTSGDSAKVMLDSAKTDEALKLFETAEAAQSSSWHEVGAMNDDDDPNALSVSRLTVSGGPGVRLAIRDGDSCLNYDLRPEDLAAFERAMRTARRHFDNDDVDRGVTPHLYPPEEAFQRGYKSIEPIPQTFPGCR